MKKLMFLSLMIGMIFSSEVKAQFNITGPMQISLLIDSMGPSNATQLSANYLKFDVTSTGVVGAPCGITASFGTYPSTSNLGTTIQYTIPNNGTSTVSVTSVSLPADTIGMVLTANNGSIWGVTSTIWFINPTSGGTGCTISAVASPTTICTGSSTLTASGASTYAWSTGGSGSSISVSPTTTTTYNVTGTSSGATCSATVTVIVTTSVVALITGNLNLACSGGITTITASGGTSFYWLPGGQTTAAIIVNSAGTYTVLVSSSCGSDTASVLVTSGSFVPTITAGGLTEFCQGGNVTLTANTGTAYLWSTGAITPAIIVTSAGNYYCSITNSGCSGLSPSIQVIVNSLPPVPSVISTPINSSACQGSNVILTATGGYVGYLWSSGDSTQNISVTNTGAYTVIITDTNGCKKSSLPKNVTIYSLPTVSITSGSTTVCTGETVTATAFPSGGLHYYWSTGDTTRVVGLTATGTYTVTVTNSNGCTGTGSIAITVASIPNAIVTVGDPAEFCQGDSATLIAHPYGLSYLWSTNETTSTIEVGSPGVYTVTVTNGYNCSDNASSPTITVHDNPVASIQLTGSNLTATPVSGQSPFTYEWSWNGTIIGTTASIIAGANGVYSVVLTDANGCTGENEVTYSFYSIDQLEGNDKNSIEEHEQIMLFDVTGRLITTINSPNDFAKSEIYKVEKEFIDLSPGCYFWRSSRIAKKFVIGF